MDNSFIIGLEGLGVLVLLIAIRVPIAYSMLVVGIAGVMILSGPAIILSQLKDLAYAQFSSYGLSVVPMFILMGSLSTHAGLSRDLFRAANTWLGRFRGGVAMAAIVACAGFGSVCGSSLATASTMGKVALPELKRLNYSPALATGTVAAGGDARDSHSPFYRVGDLCDYCGSQHRYHVYGCLYSRAFSGPLVHSYDQHLCFGCSQRRSSSGKGQSN